MKFLCKIYVFYRIYGILYSIRITRWHDHQQLPVYVGLHHQYCKGRWSRHRPGPGVK